MVHMKKYLDVIIIFIFSFIIAAVTTVPDSDQISIWILNFIDGMPLGDFYKPYRLPEPANHEFGYRPLSVLMVKLYLYFFDITYEISSKILFCKILISNFFFAYASYLWFREHNLGKRSLYWSLIITLSGPHLFGLWRLTEFDGIGAGFILFVLLILKKNQLSYFDCLWIAFSSAGSLFLKESSALLFFAMLVANGTYEFRSHNERYKRSFFVLIPCLFIWVVGAWDLLIGEENSLVGTVEWTARIPVILFTSWQYLYFISIPALLLIILSCLPQKYQGTCLWIGFSILFVLPPLEIYNHYETIYFSPRWVGIVCTLFLYFCLFFETFFKNNLQALLALSCQAVMWLAIAFSSTLREDMATRIFLPALPSIILILDTSWQKVKQRSDRTQFKGILMIEICVLWYFMSIAFNTLVERRTIDKMSHHSVKKLYHMSPSPGSLILYNNFNFSLGNEIFFPTEQFTVSKKGTRLLKRNRGDTIDITVLRAIQEHSQCNRSVLYRELKKSLSNIHIEVILQSLHRNGLIEAQWAPYTIYIPDMITEIEGKKHFPSVVWSSKGEEALNIEKEYLANQEIWMFWSAKRRLTSMDEHLIGDFSYTRRPLGAMGVLHQEQNDGLPNHNFMEDMYKVSITSKPTPLFQLIDERGLMLSGRKFSFYLLPVHLYQSPLSLFWDGSFLRKYEYSNYIFKIDHP